jgi:hypothetical protein
MVFDVIGANASALTAETLLPQLMDTDPALADPERQSHGSTESVAVTRSATATANGAAPVPSPRRLPVGVVMQLLRSAVALQAESVLRTAGALSGAWGGMLDRTEWIERDARDLGALAAAAASAGVHMPAGVDAGAGEPGHPSTVVEGLLAGHEALAQVLRQLTQASGVETAPWRPVVDNVLHRREEEMVLLRAVGAAGQLPADEVYVHGTPPRA